jgi:hypothetical protein
MDWAAATARAWRHALAAPARAGATPLAMVMANDPE